MKKIAMLVSEIKEELEGAEHYAKQALKNKEYDRDLASTYDKLSEIEKSHANMLHDQVVRIIRDYRASGNEPPAGMMEIWEFEHEKLISDMARVQVMIDAYRRK